MNILNGLLFSQYKLHHRCSTRLYIGLWKYWNFQSEAKVEQIIAIVTTRSVSCCDYLTRKNTEKNPVNSCYHMVLSAIWEIFSELFWNSFHNTLGKWNNSKIWETTIISRRRAIFTLPLNTCWNQMYQELLYLTNCIELANYKLMLTLFKWVEEKTASNNFTWLYFAFHNNFVTNFRNNFILSSFVWYSVVFCNRFVFECFVLNIRLHDYTFRKHVPTKLVISLFDMFYIKFGFCETLAVKNSMTRILLIYKHCLTL